MDPGTREFAVNHEKRLIVCRYRMEINPLVFLLAAGVAAAVAFITLPLQSFRTASGNPVQALHYE